ncbi:sensor histidine kinase [Microbispora corallina]|uniref:histidine kinase n=1 Tax=Microbispora corallina TaxID=83302 RepID=A0ABQ4G898_9ACTN|nr:CHASE3 domain-containing protein [Microbispora corallina]GIH43302.1 histidine kinase [Microbispora corallina]
MTTPSTSTPLTPSTPATSAAPTGPEASPPPASPPDAAPHDAQGPVPLLRRTTVQGWFQIVLGLMILLVVAGTVVGARLLADTTRVSDYVISTLGPARVDAYRLQTALLDQETGARGYAIAAQPSFLQPYTAGKQAEAEAAARLRALLGGQSSLLADLESIEAAGAGWRRSYAEPLIASVTVGAPRPIDTATADRGKAAFDRIRVLLNTQTAHLDQARTRGVEQLRHIRTVRSYVLGALVAVFVLAAIVLGVLLHLLVARPLWRLRVASRRVADGEFTHRITPQGPADLRAMADDVENMRRRIVAELQASQAQQEALARQAADLDAQAAELRRSNGELEQFAYVASHDLQEPLRKVASFCQMLERRYRDKLDERGVQYIDFAVDGAKRMQVLINDLLTFSRVGRLNDAQADVALDQVVDKALTNLAAAVEESGARIERPDELPRVVGDPALLAMLWQNLIGNAVKFRHPERPPVVRVDCEPDAERAFWVFGVADNGIGIPEEFNEKVFVIFQRLHSRDQYSGTGIGLALCKKIVEHHGGRIWIDTGYTGGTRFCFTMPISAPTTTPTAATTAATTASVTTAQARPPAAGIEGTSE